tara:strand:+ start:556 stop:1398 length:843 start_codon:yes stop_codon:yes gene_type:complete
MKFNILFMKNNENTGFIEILCHNNLTSKTFIEAIKKTTGVSSFTGRSFSKNKIEVVNDFIELKNKIDLINQTDYDKKIEIDLDTGLTEKKLFDIHEFFEDIGQRARTGEIIEKEHPELFSLGSEMNTLIHKLEANLFYDTFQWFQAALCEPNVARTELTEDILKEAVKDYKSNHIYVGYGETGKNLFHAQIFNEVDLVKRKMVQPQRAILSEFFIAFGDGILGWDAYEKWCIENEVVSYGYDYKNPIYFAKWEIGKIVNKSFASLKDFPNYDFITIEISE